MRQEQAGDIIAITFLSVLTLQQDFVFDYMQFGDI